MSVAKRRRLKAVLKLKGSLRGLGPFERDKTDREF